ncbi:MAG: hypothetical protein Q7R90_05145 [bacterium]|nr:hypothetical protein [bacterium]
MADVRTIRIGSASLEEVIDDPDSKVPLLIRPKYAWSANDLDRLNRHYGQIPAADDPAEFLEFHNKEILVRFTRLFVDEQHSILRAIRNKMKKMNVNELRLDVLWGKSRRDITVYKDWTAGDTPKLVFKF